MVVPMISLCDMEERDPQLRMLMGAFVELDVSMRMLLTSRRRAGPISVTHGVPTPVRARRRRFFNVFAYGMSEVDKPADAFPAELQELQTSGDLHRRTELKYHFDDRKGLLPPHFPPSRPSPSLSRSPPNWSVCCRCARHSRTGPISGR